jgi:hypothetical protein
MGLLFCTSLIALSVGCSSISVNYDFDPGADFATYKTFGWISQPTATISGNAQQAQAQSGLLGKRIISAVNTVLTQKGLTENENDPQLLVVYHTGVQDKVQVTDYGYGYGPYGGWYGGGYGGVDVYQYQEGTLVLDLVDAASKQLVWRGTAQGVLDSNPNPEKLQEKINNIVGRMLQNYPPPTK